MVPYLEVLSQLTKRLAASVDFSLKQVRNAKPKHVAALLSHFPGRKMIVFDGCCVPGWFIMAWPTDSLLVIASDESAQWGFGNKANYFGPHGPDGLVPSDSEKNILLPSVINPWFKQYYSARHVKHFGRAMRYMPLGSREEFADPPAEVKPPSLRQCVVPQLRVVAKTVVVAVVAAVGVAMLAGATSSTFCDLCLVPRGLQPTAMHAMLYNAHTCPCVATENIVRRYLYSLMVAPTDDGRRRLHALLVADKKISKTRAFSHVAHHWEQDPNSTDTTYVVLLHLFLMTRSVSSHRRDQSRKHHHKNTRTTELPREVS
jgi:hypothetical protein